MEVGGFKPKGSSDASSKLSDNFKKLSSGKRITSAKDDAAGLAIVASLEANTKLATQAVRNIADGFSVTQVADSALQNVSGLVERNAELASQAANGTLNDDQRATLNKEYQSNLEEINRISQTTEFNGVKLLTGSNEISIQVGPGSDANSRIAIKGIDVSGAPSDISTIENARAALDSSRQQTSAIAGLRGDIGATESRLKVASDNNLVGAENSEAAASRIRDVDYAAEVADLTANRIRQQVDVALKAQANLASANVFQFLK